MFKFDFEIWSNRIRFLEREMVNPNHESKSYSHSQLNLNHESKSLNINLPNRSFESKSTIASRFQIWGILSK